MALRIITADERLAEARGIKAVIFGKSGIGKTYLLLTLDDGTTLFIDLEAGDLAVQHWRGTSIRPRTWEECRDIALFLAGPNPALRDDQPYSVKQYARVVEAYGDPACMDGFVTIFVDSITVAARLCFQWCRGQPEAHSEKTGKPDLRGAYGRTTEGQAKLHVWWRLSEPAEGQDLQRLCQLRGDIAAKVGGDPHFRSAHQPIRVPGSIYRKGGVERLVTIRRHQPQHEVDLSDFGEAVAAMPAMPGQEAALPAAQAATASLDAILTTPVREGAQDAWTRFQGASAAIGHFVRQVHEGRITPDQGWEAICGYNAACLRPVWPLDRLKAEADALWALHVERNGPPLLRAATSPPSVVPAHSLGELLDDISPMPEDLIGPRLLTPGGLLVLGGAPKVGKSDFLISLLVHAAAGAPFLRFTAPRPLRVFYLQAEIQYHYLRERLQQLRLDPGVVARARDTLVVTPKLRMLLNEQGVPLVAAAIRAAFPDAPPDIICIDPIRNLFDGGPAGEGENDNAAMMFFLQSRVEALRDQVAPEAGIILAHHTKKLSKQQVKDDPFLSLSGASALRGYYTSGAILFRPDEEQTPRELHVELRNGPGLSPMLVDKVGGRWVELNRGEERLVRQELGRKLDAERTRRHDVILTQLAEEAVEGRLYTSALFAEKFENQGGLGGNSTIRERISVLATKGHIKFLKDGAPFGLPYCRSKFGYLVIEDMEFGPGKEAVDSDTGEITTAFRRVLPSHFKEPSTGAAIEVENPEVWVRAPGGETP